MHGLVIDVGAQTLSDIKPIASSFWCLTEDFLLIGNIMLCGRNDPSILDASDGGIDQGAGQIWVRTEPFL